MTTHIPLSAPDITEAEIDAVTAVLRTPHLSFGPELAAFESALAIFHGVPHAVAVSSGTAGLHLALLTLNIGAGDEVIIPSFAFIAVANAVLEVRAKPVLAEIDPVTLNLDPAAVERAITPHTRAILVVHTFGVPADMDELQSIARLHNLALIEDACEAIGAEYEGRRAGSFGDLAVFGFYPNKQITTGEGGAVLAHNPAYAARLRSLRNQGRQPDSRSHGRAESAQPGGLCPIHSAASCEMSGKEQSQRELPASPCRTAGGVCRTAGDWLDHAEPGYNYRLSDIACALGRVQLSRIHEILPLRQAAAQRYHARLNNFPGLELPPQALPIRTISWFVYVVRLPQSVDRNRVQADLAQSGIATGRYFPPIHLQPAWRNQPGLATPHLPITESIARRTLALPFFNRITPAQQEQVASILIDALRSAG